MYLVARPEDIKFCPTEILMVLYRALTHLHACSTAPANDDIVTLQRVSDELIGRGINRDVIMKGAK